MYSLTGIGIIWQRNTLKDCLTAHRLGPRNQFIGIEDMSSWWLTTPCVHVIFSEGGFAAGFVTTSDLISFSYASKSQVRQMFGMIQGQLTQIGLLELIWENPQC